MSELAIIVFEGRHTADEALLRLAKMDQEWEANLDDVAVLTGSIWDIMLNLAWQIDMPAEHVADGRTLETFQSQLSDGRPPIRQVTRGVFHATLSSYEKNASLTRYWDEVHGRRRCAERPLGNPTASD